MKATKRQEVKDKLWRLDEDVERMAAEVMRRTAAAWKATIEGGNVRAMLVHAYNEARALADRIAATMEDL